MTLWVSTVVRNEADRHLTKMLDCARRMNAHVIATDDNSTDNTVEVLLDHGVTVQINDGPPFWEHEGRMRQRHLEFLDWHASPGDWVLALDADETISNPDKVRGLVEQAEQSGFWAISLRLHEFWTETEYRIDGYWFGTVSPILYKWRPDGRIQDRPMGCGREPTYVSTLSPHQVYPQEICHWLHWGYVREADRIRKHKAYTERLGGHGHSNAHVESIIAPPTLRSYEGDFGYTRLQVVP